MNLTDSPAIPKKRFRLVLFGVLGLALTSLFFRQPIQNALTLHLILKNEVPSEEVVQELLSESKHPDQILWKLWNTNKLPHRAQVIHFLSQELESDTSWRSDIEALLIEASQDVDLEVRRIALGVLHKIQHQNFPGIAAAQLWDRDSEAQLIGLQYLSKIEKPPPGVTRKIIEILDHSEPYLVASASTVLKRWTQQDFGIRNYHAVPKISKDESTAMPLEKEKVDVLRSGVDHWKSWWATQPAEIQTLSFAPPVPIEEFSRRRLPVADFTLPDIDGKPVHLSDFKGKKVLLNFWATWCTTCLGEIPEINAFQKDHPDSLVVLGISLDGPSGHDHDHDHPHESEPHPTEPEKNPPPKETYTKELTKIKRVIQQKKITYTILHDPLSTVGKRFNGGELPTQVLLDESGQLIRRFVGGRTLAEWNQLFQQATIQ